MRLHDQLASTQDPHVAGAGFVIEGVTEEQVGDVYRLMYRHVGNRDEAEELTERACVRAVRAAWQHFPDGLDRQRMAAVLSQTARSVLEAHVRWFYRSTVCRPQTPEGAMLPASDAEDHGEGASVPDRADRILAQLSERERDFLTLRFFRQASLAETAATLHLAVGDALALQWSALHHAAQIAANQGTRPSSRNTAQGDGVAQERACIQAGPEGRRTCECTEQERIQHDDTQRR